MEITDSRTEKLPQQLLGLLAEELKAPLALATRSLELAELASDVSTLTSARASTESALELINNYALALKLANLEQGMLALEPLAISVVMAEAASDLLPLAKAYGITLEVDASARNLPVLANRRALAAALASTGRTLIEALAVSDTSEQLRLKLSCHASRYGTVTGWYWSESERITSSALAHARELLVTSRRPLTPVTTASTAGVYIADMLLAAMNSRLIASRHKNWTGLAATLIPVRQLALV